MRAIYPLALCALLVLTGCPQIFRDEDPIRHYVLGTLAEQLEADPVPGLAGVAVGIRQPRLADYLDDTGIVVRRGAHAVEVSRHHRWGGRLDREIGRAIASGMVARADFGRVDLVPFPPYAVHDFLVHLDVRRFEGAIPASQQPAGDVRALIEWEIVQVVDLLPVASGAVDIREAGWTPGDFVGLVEGLDAALVATVDDVLAALAAVAGD